jgi:hypothetical protein
MKTPLHEHPGRQFRLLNGESPGLSRISLQLFVVLVPGESKYALSALVPWIRKPRSARLGIMSDNG